MVSSWAENSPTATTCRCTGSGSPPSRQEIRRPGFAEESVRVVESCEPRHGSDTERHSRRAVLGSPGLSPRDAPHHHDSIITARGKGTAAFSRSLPFPSHITWPHHTSPWLGGGAPSPIHLPRSQHCAILSRDVLPSGSTPFERTRRAHSQASQPTADEQTLSADGQIAHLAPSRCSMTAWAAAKRAIGTRNGEQET